MSSFSPIVIRSHRGSYKVVFCKDVFARLKRLASEKKCFFVIDRQVAKIYAADLKGSIASGRVFLVDAREANKNLSTVERLVRFLIAADFKKNDRLIAVGGGIVQDVCGFTSSILFRGVHWTFCPTTLLAQADSCVGSKNCINMGPYKNQLGTFYPPAEILLDMSFLKSLNRRDICSGLGEIIKFFILDSRASLQLILKSYDNAFVDPALLRRLVRHSLLIKKKIIEDDEFDQGVRNIFNYGHTFGHALESVTNYRISHGQAITLGMGLANFISWKLGYLSPKDHDLLRPLIAANSPDFSLPKDRLGPYLLSLTKDKKNVGRKLTCILLRSPGKAFKTTLPFDPRLRSLIREYFTL